MEEQTLLSRLRLGDEELLKTIYTQYREDFMKWIMSRNSITLDQATELFQESIVILFENAVKGQIKNSNFNIKSYLISIAKHKIREGIRAKKKFRQNNMIVHQLWISESDFPEEELEIVEQCLSELGDTCQEILKLFYYYGMDISRIADKMEYKNNETCKSMKSKCLKKLKEKVREQLHLKHKTNE